MDKTLIEIGTKVIPDKDKGNTEEVTVKWCGEIFAEVETDKGYRWSIMKNRLTIIKK